MRSLIGVIAAIALLACGGTGKTTSSPDDKSPDGDSDIGEGSGDGHKVDPSAPVSAEECDRFTAHVLELNMVQVRAEMERKGTPELIPSEEQVAKIRKDMASQCLTFPRPVVECGTVAPTLEAFVACQDKAPDR